ncbi:sensor histidine kinase [Luedemannella helvata]|uniref:histidine kinase n=1 Tax=Luedemannella helvata TaxID=349315 RepID=A0ABN2KNI4_9ACTN
MSDVRTSPARRLPGGDWSLRTRVAALCGLLVAIILLLAGGAATTALTTRSSLDTLLDDIGPMRTGANDLMQSLLDQETGMRGYALRGGTADLEPYAKGQANQQALTAAIATNPAATATVKEQLAIVTERAEQWRRDVAEPAIALVRDQGTVPAQEFLNQQATRPFDDIRAAVANLQASIVQIRNDSADTVKSSSTRVVWVLFAAAAVVLLGGIGMVLLLQRLVIRPVSDLAAQVRTVATGDYDLEISSPGPPELARLARDVDRMRARIAADLSEVEAARAVIEANNLRLEAQATELERSNRDLEQFAYVASHDLQEPLRKVASFCQLLQRRYAGQLDERADQYIAFAVNGAQRMQRLINDLLAFSRIGRNTAGFTEVSLEQVMTEVTAQTEAGLTAAKATLTWDDDLPVVRGEERLLVNLLANLVSNSLKFRRPDVPATVHVSVARVGDDWEVSCADNGIGIEDEFAEKVFVIFQRLHARETYPGTGIGLAIAKKIVEYHGGRIWVAPSDGPGATIRFTLPATDTADPQTSSPQNGEAPGATHAAPHLEETSA